MNLIIAPPGAGKTRTLVEQIHQRLDGGVSPYRILATTFSRQGARELTERLGGDVTVRTVHSLAWWVVRIARRARGQRIPQVLTAEEVRALIERAIQQEGAKYIEPAQVLAGLSAVREHGVAVETLHPMVGKVIHTYQRLLAEEHRIDFTGILAAAQGELADPDLQAFLSGMHLFVDEAQDLTPHTEWPVLEGFRQAAEQFVLLASPSQQIYGFKGARWEALVECFPQDTVTRYLETNYRSTPEIVEASRALAGPDARHMRPARPSLYLPVTRTQCLDAGLELDFLGRTIARWQAAGIALAEIAVLARAHALLHPLQQLLRERRIPYQLLGARPDFYHRAEIAAAHGYLALALDPCREALLEQVINEPPAGIGVRLRYRLRGEGTLTWRHLEDVVADPDAHPTPLVERARVLLTYRRMSPAVVADNENVPTQVDRLLALTPIPDALAGEGDLEGLRALADLSASAVEYADLRAFCEHLAEAVAQPQEASGVQLGTLHAAKGREWNAVLLPNFQDGVLPLRKMDAAEERNLAFVGLTRARDLLAITFSRTGRPSPFLDGMATEDVTWP